jgi:hypothetical protein
MQHSRTIQTANRYLASIAAVSVCVLLLSFASCTRGSEKFDQRRWIDAGDDLGSLVRSRMVHDVSTNILYVGMSRASVESALGHGSLGVIDDDRVVLSYPIYRERRNGPVSFLTLQLDDRENVVGWSEGEF